METIFTRKGEKIFVDKDDYEWLGKFTWMIDSQGYAAAMTSRKDGQRKKIRMHRLITGFKSDKVVDHRDRNKLNNQRNNLRLCNRTQNNGNQRESSLNTSGFKGVHYKLSKRRFVASISRHRKTIYVGAFKSAKEAAIAYDRAAKEIFGEFALTNEMLGLLPSKQVSQNQ